jgi:hypothetical protein
VNEPKKPYTRPQVVELPSDDPRALALFAEVSGLVPCCGILWSVSAATDYHVGLTKKCGASFDGLCGKCRKALPKPAGSP